MSDKEQSYQETLDYIFAKLPMFSRVGSSAYKKDLTNTLTLCAFLGNPQNSFRSVHIGGTNGKGSTTNYLASMAIENGLKVGIYTSPHLIDFRERIRIGHEMIPKEYVVSFVDRIRPLIEEIEPSFFEITVAMAFDYFASQEIDIAFIEVGLGGRLDSTNIITPILSIITNVSFDHMNMLGDTLEKIAVEKAGIIKNNRP
ncbi:MAG: bifunctional folylpolyglutamate synthase/dihydrofolate synthase, partial [Chitinophagales bacterium]